MKRNWTPKGALGTSFYVTPTPAALPGPSCFTCQLFCCLDASCAILDPSWNSPGDLSESLLQPSWGPFGCLLGASAGFFCNSTGSSRRHTIQKRQAALRHGHLVHIFFIFFNEPLFLNTFMPATIPKVHHKTYIHKDGKKKWGGGGAPLGQSIESGHPPESKKSDATHEDISLHMLPLQGLRAFHQAATVRGATRPIALVSRLAKMALKCYPLRSSNFTCHLQYIST